VVQDVPERAGLPVGDTNSVAVAAADGWTATVRSAPPHRPTEAATATPILSSVCFM
jgi:hypothetical protein